MTIIEKDYKAGHNREVPGFFYLHKYTSVESLIDLPSSTDLKLLPSTDHPYFSMPANSRLVSAKSTLLILVSKVKFC